MKYRIPPVLGGGVLDTATARTYDVYGKPREARHRAVEVEHGGLRVLVRMVDLEQIKEYPPEPPTGAVVIVNGAPWQRSSITVPRRWASNGYFVSWSQLCDLGSPLTVWTPAGGSGAASGRGFSVPLEEED